MAKLECPEGVRPPSPAEVILDARESHHTCPERYSIVDYRWDFGDGSPPVTTDVAIVKHAFPVYYKDPAREEIDWAKTTQTYPVALTVADNRGETARVPSCAVQIGPPPWKPVADPNGPYEGCVGESVTLDGSSSFSPYEKILLSNDPLYQVIAKWEWFVREGNAWNPIGEGEKLQHAWTQQGLYEILLRVTDSHPWPERTRR